VLGVGGALCGDVVTNPAGGASSNSMGGEQDRGTELHACGKEESQIVELVTTAAGSIKRQCSTCHSNPAAVECNLGLNGTKAFDNVTFGTCQSDLCHIVLNLKYNALNTEPYQRVSGPLWSEHRIHCRRIENCLSFTSFPKHYHYSRRWLNVMYTHVRNTDL
jgi:hypothetical protein